jgi:hypothetical protein
MSNKKQNSLEWYIEETFKLSVKFERQEISQDEYTLGYSNLLQQAKAMHKEEVKESYREGRSDQQSSSDSFYNRNAEQYYNETYGGQDESNH